MKSTITTEGGIIRIEATAGRVETNGVRLLPHEAALIANELNRAALRADSLAAVARYEARYEGISAAEKAAVLGD